MITHDLDYDWGYPLDLGTQKKVFLEICYMDQSQKIIHGMHSMENLRYCIPIFGQTHLAKIGKDP